MLKGCFRTKDSLFIEKAHKHYNDGELSIYVIGKIYNLDNPDYPKYILEGYKRIGNQIFKQLDGSFIIIIYSPNETIIVRDRHGLNYQIFFDKKNYCSSLYNLIDISDSDAIPDYQSLAFFLTAGHIKAPDSSFKNISKLEAGHLLISKTSGEITIVNLYPYNDITPVLKLQKSEDEYADEFYDLHKQAIRRRIKDEQKVGIFLSGGYDSGANLVALREIYNGDVQSYSIGFKGSDMSELPQAKLMADTFGSVHKEYEIDGTEIKKLPEIIRHFGDPFAECGMMVNYSVFGLSGMDCPGVLLGGEGNDHYFSTANRQIAINYLTSKYKLTTPLTLMKKVLDTDKYDKDGIIFRTRFHLETSLNIIQGEIFGFPRYQIPKFLKDPLQLKPLSVIKPESDNYDKLYLQHVLRTDVEKSLNRIILFKSSKIAEMYNSHIAYPFVDIDMFNFINNLPANLKCKGDSYLSIAMGKGVSKYLHKKIYAPKMPKLIAAKPKQGGFVPMAIFFTDEKQRKILTDIVLSSSICDEFLNRKEIEKFLYEFNQEIKQPVKWFWYRQIKCNQFFNLLSLAIWWEEFVNKKKVIV